MALVHVTRWPRLQRALLLEIIKAHALDAGILVCKKLHFLDF